MHHIFALVEQSSTDELIIKRLKPKVINVQFVGKLIKLNVKDIQINNKNDE